MLFFIDEARAELPPAQYENAIVSIVIGELYQQVWERIARAQWEAYAQHCELDIIIIRTPLDVSDRAKKRSPSWQKMLILAQPWSDRYERIIWLDADISINPQAQSILPYTPDPSKISLSIAGDRMSLAEKQIFYERLYNVEMKPDFIAEFFRQEMLNLFSLYGITEYGNMYNAGVLVLSPKHHAELFAEVYGVDHSDSLYEQPFLSAKIDARGLAHIINPRFNWGILETMALYVPRSMGRELAELSTFELALLEGLLYREFRNAYFLHFYGCFDLMKSLRGPLTVD